MFAWWGRAVVRARWWVLAATVLVMAVGVAWGSGVFSSLSGGGFNDPASPSSVAAKRITDEFGRQDVDVIVLYTSRDATVDQPAVRDAIVSTLDNVRRHPEVATVTSTYDGTSISPALVSHDRHATYAIVQLRATDADRKRLDLDVLRPALAAPGLDTQIGGGIGFFADADHQIESDIQRAEMFSLPLLLILMIFIFRGLVAALTPLLVGVFSILGAFTATRVLAGFTEVSIFAINIITMLGLGMGIDYALFVVSRFREELAAGRGVEAAVVTTLTTAGRTVVVSGVIVALALASLLIFPLSFLRSMGFGGMAAVLVAMVAALTALPALLAVLGHRINAGRVLGRRAAARAADRTRRGGWGALADSVMRRPVLYLVLLVALLGGLASPFLRAEFGGFDERVLPAGTSSRTVSERLAAEFPGATGSPLTVLVGPTNPAAAQAYASALAGASGVTGAQVIATRGSSTGIATGGSQAGTTSSGDQTLISVQYRGEPSSAPARDTVRAVRAVPAPAGAQVFVAGRPAADLDELDGLGRQLPWQALIVAVVTFVLLFLAFGSVVLPLKAILMNLVSIGASFGVVVWVFQDGHLANLLGFTPTGFLEPTNVILMLAILFGLSTDYEVFLLSRVREEWDATGDNRAAVRAGVQRTGGIITAAALLLMIVIGGFASGGAATVKMLGVGTLVAVAVDAGLVRTLLVPATMRLLGRWNWWAPGPLARLYRRYGLHRTEPVAVPGPRVPVGASAA